MMGIVCVTASRFRWVKAWYPSPGRVILNDERTALPGHDQIVLCGLLNAAGAGNFPLNDALYRRALVLGHPSPIDEVGENRLGERWVTLPPIQYRLLLTLAERAGEVIACQELLRLVWGYDAGETEARVATLEVVLRQIRDLIAAGQEARRAVTLLAEDAHQQHWRSICLSCRHVWASTGSLEPVLCPRCKSNCIASR